MKVTVPLNASLYRAIDAASVRSGRSVDAILDEAIATWLAATEDRVDGELAAFALAQDQREGGTTADAFFKTLAAESKAAHS